MKKTTKILTVATVMGMLVCANANAKTEGHYVGVDLINTDMKLSDNNYSGNNTYNIKSDSKNSLGVNYKYAFNFKDFFVAPVVFYDYSNVELADNSNGVWELESRIGIGTDLGYDITNKFAVFGNISITRNRYFVNWRSEQYTKKDHATAMSYGIGVKYSATDNIDVKLAYEVSSFDMREPSVVGLDGSGNYKSDFDIDVIKLGMAYKF